MQKIFKKGKKNTYSSKVLFLNERKQNITCYQKHFEFALGTPISNISGFHSNPNTVTSMTKHMGYKIDKTNVDISVYLTRKSFRTRKAFAETKMAAH